MDIINLTKNEMILFNKAKIKYLELNIETRKITNSKIMEFLLRKYIGEKNARRI